MALNRDRAMRVVVVGGGIGGLAAALALARLGIAVTLLEQSAEIAEIGAGLQLAPNAFAAINALGIGERVRQRSVFTERLVMMDAVAASGQGRSTLLGDAAHPMLQYLAQSACMALEDAVTLAKAVEARDFYFEAAFRLYEAARLTRTARVVLSTREMGRLYHASGVERLVRNSLWTGRTPEQFYDALAWLYGWKADDWPDRLTDPNT